MPWIWLWVKWIAKTSMYSYSSSSPNPVSRLRNEGADNCKKHLSCTWRIDSILADKLAEKHICFKTRQNNTELQSIIAGGFGSEAGGVSKTLYRIQEWFGANRLCAIQKHIWWFVCFFTIKWFHTNQKGLSQLYGKFDGKFVIWWCCVLLQFTIKSRWTMHLADLEVYAETVSMCPSARHVPSHRPHGDLVGLKVKIQDLPSQEKKALKFNIEIAYVPNRKRDSCRDVQHVSGRRGKLDYHPFWNGTV